MAKASSPLAKKASKHDERTKQKSAGLMGALDKLVASLNRRKQRAATAKTKRRTAPHPSSGSTAKAKLRGRAKR